MFNDDPTPAAGDSRRLSERNMPITPLDVRQARFPTVMRGFDRQEVTTFLAEAAEDYDLALRENERLRQEVARLEGSLAHFRALEGSLKNTLISAQKLADDIKENAGKEAERLVREAEGRAEMVMQKAQTRLDDVQREIDGLKLKRRETETSIEATISALNHSLAFIREQDGRERQEKVLPLRPRAEAVPASVTDDAPTAPTIVTAQSA